MNKIEENLTLDHAFMCTNKSNIKAVDVNCSRVQQTRCPVAQLCFLNCFLLSALCAAIHSVCNRIVVRSFVLNSILFKENIKIITRCNFVNQSGLPELLYSPGNATIYAGLFGTINVIYVLSTGANTSNCLHE